MLTVLPLQQKEKEEEERKAQEEVEEKEKEKKDAAQKKEVSMEALLCMSTSSFHFHLPGLIVICISLMAKGVFTFGRRCHFNNTTDNKITFSPKM